MAVSFSVRDVILTATLSGANGRPFDVDCVEVVVSFRERLDGPAHFTDQVGGSGPS